MKTGLGNLWRWLLGVLLLAASAAHAADTDLFAGTNRSTGVPNVLFVIDTGAAFSANSEFKCHINPITKEVNTTAATAPTGFVSTALNGKNGGVEQCALYSVLNQLTSETAKVRVGIMFFNNGMKTFNPAGAGSWGTECSANNPIVGGCLAMKITPLDTTHGPNIAEYVRQWEVSGNSNYNIKAPSNRGDGATMQEAWAYFNAKQGISGRTYASGDLPTGDCGDNIIIFLGNNWEQQASPADATNDSASPWKRLTGNAGVPALQRASPAAESAELKDLSDTVTTSCGTKTLDGTDEVKGGRALNWALYLKNYGISTITIGIMKPGVCDATYGAQLARMGSAEIGGGGFTATTDYESIRKALLNAFGRVLAKNSVFAAVSLPVSVNTQGSYLNRVYIGMFRPAASYRPRWNGNLKQYKLGYVGTDLKMLDADSEGAINTKTGFIGECARSYWTPTALDTYWTLSAEGDCAEPDTRASNTPDGNIVEKGAQAYVLRTLVPANRNVKTCSPVLTSCSSLTDFKTTNLAVSDTLLGVPNGQRSDLINWVRGQNVANPDELDMGNAVMRGSAHGDVVHSRPVAVNHGTDNAPQIVVYYGANDGMLHAVNGNRNDPANASTGQITSDGRTFAAGAELWSFIPPQFWGKVKRLYDNTINVSYPDTTAATHAPKDYSMDGPITAFTGSLGGSNKVAIFASMRRGGRIVYAFDVTTPAAPTLLWAAGCDSAGNCAPGYTDGAIGQTWASLKSMYVAGHGGGTTPLLIMGGGYDDCEDYDALTAGGANHNCTSSSKGKRLYVIDAATGAVVRAFGSAAGETIDRGIIADATLVRDNNTGKIKYAYTADLGGNVYRVDFTAGSGSKDDWTIKKIASLGCDTLAACTANRKFMFAPSVVTDDEGVTFYLGLGSGDREKPVNWYTSAKTVANYYFMIKDKPTVANWTHDTDNCGTGTTVLCKDSLLLIPKDGATPTQTELNTKPKGWQLGLAATEQVVTTSVTVYGVSYFSTHKPEPPSPNVCSIRLGETNVYSIEYKNANSANGTDQRYGHVAGDGLPPSPVAGQIKLDDGKVVPFCIGCTKDSPLEGTIPGAMATAKQPKNRLYWYIQK